MDTADTRRFIIDTDGGIDDVQAIFLALKRLNVTAITTVAGNVHVDKVTRNVGKLLSISQTKISVFEGADSPLIKDLDTAEYFHGEDGIGDSLEIAGIEPDMELVSYEKHAAEVIAEEAKNGSLSLLCIGPLTNIALAMMLNPDLPQQVENIYMMGGTLYGKGNGAPNKEYNFASDPEATAKVINSFKHMHIIPWEAGIDFRIPKEMGTQFFESDKPKMKFFGETHKSNFERNSLVEIGDGFVAAIAIDPSLGTEYHDLVATAFTQGDAAGQISYAWPKYTFSFNEKDINGRVYHKFKLEETVEMLTNGLNE